MFETKFVNATTLMMQLIPEPDESKWHLVAFPCQCCEDREAGQVYDQP